MKYTVKDFRVEDNEKVVGFIVKNGDDTLIIDKRIPIVEGKTDEEYMKEAHALAQPEVIEWESSNALIGKEWNPETNLLTDAQ